MRKTLCVGLLFLLSFCCVGVSLRAQSADEARPAGETTGGDDSDYLARRGANEFGVWGGGAFKAVTAFGGLRPDEARDRKFFIVALRYGRTLAANESVALQYTLDVIPAAVATGDITQQTTVTSAAGTATVFRRETAYGAGLTPLGLQLDFRNSSHVKPFVHVNAGGLIFNKPVPLPDAGRFAFTLEGGAGVRVYGSPKRAVTLGVRLHHISNGDRSGSNRGLNQFVIYTGFSFFR